MAAKRPAAAPAIQSLRRPSSASASPRSTSTTMAQPISGMRRLTESTRWPRPSENSPAPRGPASAADAKVVRSDAGRRKAAPASPHHSGATTRIRPASGTTTKRRSCAVALARAKRSPRAWRASTTSTTVPAGVPDSSSRGSAIASVSASDPSAADRTMTGCRSSIVMRAGSASSGLAAPESSEIESTWPARSVTPTTIPDSRPARLDELPVREGGLLGRSPARRDEGAHAVELARPGALRAATRAARARPRRGGRPPGARGASSSRARSSRSSRRMAIAARMTSRMPVAARATSSQPGKRPDPRRAGRRQRRRSGSPRVVHAHALISAAPQCRPAPSAVNPTRSPGRIRPAALASWKTSGSVAAVVFP